MSFGERVRKRREQLGFTQKALAVLLAIQQSTISDWERQTIPPKDRARLEELARALQWTLDDLLGVEPNNGGLHLVKEPHGGYATPPPRLPLTDEQFDDGTRIFRSMEPDAQHAFYELLKTVARRPGPDESGNDTTARHG